MITDCWKPQAGGRMNRSSLVAQRLPIDAALDGRATRKLDRGGQVDGKRPSRRSGRLDSSAFGSSLLGIRLGKSPQNEFRLHHYHQKIPLDKRILVCYYHSET
jgi:hypothetical protein